MSRFSNGVVSPPKKALIDIIVITTLIGKATNYISALDTRQLDRRLVPSFTTEKGSARGFFSIEAAEKLIPHIVNHLERVFKVETIQVERPVEV